MNPLLISSSRLARAVLRTESDERLAELAASGSDAAFASLVDRYRHALVRHCRRLTGDSDAEEAVQIALVRAHRALVRGDEVRNVGAWLHAIAHNAALNLVRARSARPEPANGDIEHCCGAHHDDGAAGREDFRELIDAVHALPERQRDAIVMRELEGRSYEEIAARMQTSSGAVRQLLNRARTALRERVGAFTGAEPLVRWLLDGGNGPAVARIGALTGGCAVTAKLCAVALLPAAVAVNVAQAPSKPTPHTAATAAAARTATHTAPAARTATRPARQRTVEAAAPAEKWRFGSTPANQNAKVRPTATYVRAAVPVTVAKTHPIAVVRTKTTSRTTTTAQPQPKRTEAPMRQQRQQQPEPQPDATRMPSAAPNPRPPVAKPQAPQQAPAPPGAPPFSVGE
jgi:RNA polymerase sigma factor (sigma-70 family)